MPQRDTSESRVAPLLGLVLAGGESRRMGRDKGLLRYGGEPQARRAWRMLMGACGDAYVSVRAAQAGRPGYAELPLIVDAETEALGPAAGLLAAWARRPDAAWLALAADLPFVDEDLLARLMRGRDHGRLATAFRHPDGVPEPLCSIWEPAARGPLLEQASSGDRSLRRLLLAGAAALLEIDDPSRLESVDAASDYELAQRRFGSSEEDA
jgi:molybdopterin-guanine dinucleotide biosynthesis protein A